MQPGGAVGCKGQVDPPATGHRVRDRDAPSPSSPAVLSSEEQRKHAREDEQQQPPAASLPEGPLVEILARVPYSSLCRFKCVSKSWLALCSHPEIRKRSQQTLSGFFYFTVDVLQFRNLSGRGPPMVDPSLPFLRESYRRVTVKQCGSSLLLCQCWKSSSEDDGYDYVVCNPATERWIVLPPTALPDQDEIHLFNIFIGFNMAAPSRFVVFAPLSRCCDESAVVAIYSSETGRWTFVQSEWGDDIDLVGYPECVFLNRTMHLTSYFDSVVLTVDTGGTVWRKIRKPDTTPSIRNAIASIGQSQGRLYAWRIDNRHDCRLYVWVLEDYDTGKWTLKHTVNVLELFTRHSHRCTGFFTMLAIHPECNLIFLTDGKEMTVSYDLDNQKLHVICNSGEFLGGLPYTPCFAEWQSDGH